MSLNPLKHLRIPLRLSPSPATRNSTGREAIITTELTYDST
jgi:hypothetical protein